MVGEQDSAKGLAPDSVDIGADVTVSLSRKTPPAPKIFIGRDDEKRAVLAAVTGQSTPGARVAVLGAPGIGKTSVALTVFHDAVVTLKYGSRRYFVQCDTATAPGSLLLLIALALDIPERNTNKLRRGIVTNLSQLDTLLVLDNFESAWDAEECRADAEALLSMLGEVDSLALIITMRGTERPTGVRWTRPFLPVLEPLSNAAALQTFAAISDVSETDPDLVTLMQLVDRMPLAITLMANMVQYENCASLVRQWSEMQTAMLQRGEATRLSSVDVSIAISLNSVRLKAEPYAQQLLGLLSLLPDGVHFSDIASIAPTIQLVGRCVSILLQTALAYRTNSDRIRVLVPIRAFMLRYHPPRRDVLEGIYEHYAAFAQQVSETHRSHNATHIEATVKSELGNARSVLLRSLDNAKNLEMLIRSIIDLERVAVDFGLATLSALGAAHDSAKKHGLKALQAYSLRVIAECSRNQLQDYRARPTLHEALQLARDGKDIEEEWRCLRCLALPEDRTAYELSDAWMYANQALEVARRTGRPRHELEARRTLGLTALWDGRPNDAYYHLNVGLGVLRSLPVPDASSEMLLLHSLATILHTRGDVLLAHERMSEALSIAEKHGHREVLMHARTWLGTMELRRANLPAAIAHLDAARAAAREAAPALYAVVWIQLAEALLALDRPADAVRVLEELAVALGEREPARRRTAGSQAQALLALGHGLVDMHEGEHEAAATHFAIALEYSMRAHVDPSEIAAALYHRAQAAHALRDRATTLECFVLAAALLRRGSPDTVLVTDVLNKWADAHEAAGDASTAAALTRAVLPRITRCDEKGRMAECHFRLGRIAVAKDDTDEARAELELSAGFFDDAHDKRRADLCRGICTSFSQ